MWPPGSFVSNSLTIDDSAGESITIQRQRFISSSPSYTAVKFSPCLVEPAMLDWAFSGLYPFVVVVGSLYLVYNVIAGAIYRLYLSPISHIPGPKLAALTFWYEFYYDVILRGQYTFHIRDLHAKYGPIIRINPYELHILYPDYYETLYATSASGEKRDKWVWYAKQFGSFDSTFATIEHDLHKARRAALARYFSMASVRKLQHVLDKKVQRLMERIRNFKGADGDALVIDHAFSAFTTDVVMEYSYGRSDNCLEAKDFSPQYYNAILAMGQSTALIKQMYWLFQLMRSLPSSIVGRLSSNLHTVIQMQDDMETQIVQLLAQPDENCKDVEHPVLFQEILDSKLADSDKSAPRLREEAFQLVGAGIITTAWTLSVATYHLLENPRILRKLKEDLVSVMPDPYTSVPLEVLEGLPYFVAIVQEALRLSYGVSSRLQRVSPDKPLIFTDRGSGKEWVIPPGTPVGMTSTLMHQDETIFPKPKSFIPERWIENPRLDRYMVSFSKGSRMCVGINLAYAEIYLGLAALFRRFGSAGENGVRFDSDEGVLELFETGLEDVEIYSDSFIPFPKWGTKGVRIQVKD